jgi:CRISPR-associated protein Cas5d
VSYIGFGIKLKVWGDRACFTRPEFKAERMSYDVITPSAAVGILKAIYWKPEIRWIVDKIHVINPIKFVNVVRNELKSEADAQASMDNPTLRQISSDDRTQRNTMMLKDVCYIIEAHFELVGEETSINSEEKHYNIMIRRAKNGQCFHQPCFGCKEFAAKFELIEHIEKSCYDNTEKDLGVMLYSMEFGEQNRAVLFRAKMSNGIIDVKKCFNGGVSS